MEKVTIGGGCFWCTEAIFSRIDGIQDVYPGYCGGKIKNPSYREVCKGTTGHAECIQFLYNPKKIFFETILDIFFETHDPTTLNRQGADIGTQYRSVIFYHTEEQKIIAEKKIKYLNKIKKFKNELVTQIESYEKFYKAEIEHHDYFKNNPSQPYCSFIITPKVKKFISKFSEKIKK